MTTCSRPTHVHNWPDWTSVNNGTVKLIIEPCERSCGWCPNQKNPCPNAPALRYHARTHIFGDHAVKVKAIPNAKNNRKMTNKERFELDRKYGKTAYDLMMAAREGNATGKTNVELESDSSRTDSGDGSPAEEEEDGQEVDDDEEIMDADTLFKDEEEDDDEEPKVPIVLVPNHNPGLNHEGPDRPAAVRRNSPTYAWAPNAGQRDDMRGSGLKTEENEQGDQRFAVVWVPKPVTEQDLPPRPGNVPGHRSRKPRPLFEEPEVEMPDVAVKIGVKAEAEDSELDDSSKREPVIEHAPPGLVDTLSPAAQRFASDSTSDVSAEDVKIKPEKCECEGMRPKRQAPYAWCSCWIKEEIYN